MGRKRPRNRGQDELSDLSQNAESRTVRAEPPENPALRPLGGGYGEENIAVSPHSSAFMMPNENGSCHPTIVGVSTVPIRGLSPRVRGTLFLKPIDFKEQ